MPTVEQSFEELTALTERALLAKCSGDRVAPPAPQAGFISAVTSGVDEFLSSMDEDSNAKRRRGVKINLPQRSSFFDTTDFDITVFYRRERRYQIILIVGHLLKRHIFSKITNKMLPQMLNWFKTKLDLNVRPHAEVLTNTIIGLG